jgi:hypothetical protein
LQLCICTANQIIGKTELKNKILEIINKTHNNMTKFYTFFLLAIIISVKCYAQNNQPNYGNLIKSNSVSVTNAAYLDTNKIKARFKNNFEFFWDSQVPVKMPTLLPLYG